MPKNNLLEAEKLFLDNVIFNTMLSKAYQKGQRNYLNYNWEVSKLTPNEVLERLKMLGISISRKTLYNYEKQGLVSEPAFRNSRNTDYPEHVFAEAYTSHIALHTIKLKPSEVAEIRKKALELGKETLWKEVAFNVDLIFPLWWSVYRDNILRKEGFLTGRELHRIQFKVLKTGIGGFGAGDSKTIEIAQCRVGDLSDLLAGRLDDMDDEGTWRLINEYEDKAEFIRWQKVLERLPENRM